MIVVNFGRRIQRELNSGSAFIMRDHDFIKPFKRRPSNLKIDVGSNIYQLLFNIKKFSIGKISKGEDIFVD